jgi:ribose transport system substrate-binding protein
MSMENTVSAEKPDVPHVATYNAPAGLDEAISAVPLVQTSRRPARVGYLTNYSFHIWYQIVIELLRRRGAQYGIQIEVADAGLSVENQIEQAREMVRRVDALILTPAATSGLEEILKIAAEANVPVVVEANPVEGMSTMVAICDYDAGYDLGTWVGRNVTTNDSTALRILDVGLPGLRPCLLRSEGFADGIRSIQRDAVVVASIDGQATPSIAKRIAHETLSEKGDVDVIFAMDDETAQGAFQGYVSAGFDPTSVTVAGFGLSGDPEKDWLMRRESLKVSQAMFPEYVGLRCMDGIVALYDGQSVSVRDVVPTVSMTADILDKYYPKKDGAWTPDLTVIAALQKKSDCTRV